MKGGESCPFFLTSTKVHEKYYLFLLYIFTSLFFFTLYPLFIYLLYFFLYTYIFLCTYVLLRDKIKRIKELTQHKLSTNLVQNSLFLLFLFLLKIILYICQNTKQMEQIRFIDIMDLGFTEDKSPNDEVYYNEYGFKYRIYQKQLTDTIYLDWQKETRLCKLIRVDNPEKGNIKRVIDIQDLNHLKEVVRFFED